MKSFIVVVLIVVSSLGFAQENPQPPAETTSRDGQWRFGLGFGLSLRSNLNFRDGVVTSGGASQDFSADLDYENAFTLNFEARMMPTNDWGFMGGLQIDGEREFDGGTFTSGGTTVSLSGGSGGSKIAISNIFANAVYTWNQVYLPFGLNISAIKFTPGTTFSGSLTDSGGLGMQVGVGYNANDNIAVELTSRVTAVDIKTVGAVATSDYKTGFMGNLVLMGKYIF